MLKYCIKDASTMDIIINNLTADEAAEEFNFYESFLGQGSIFIAASHINAEQDYKRDFIELFAELQDMGNLI